MLSEPIDPEIVDGPPFDEKTKEEEHVFSCPSAEEAMNSFSTTTWGKPIDANGNINAIACAGWLSGLFPDAVYISAGNRLYRRCLKTGCYCEVDQNDFMLFCLKLLACFCEKFLECEIGYKFTPSMGKKIMGFFLDFRKNNHFFDQVDRIILHLKNCFLVWTNGKFVSYPLSTEWIHSRKMLNAVFNPKAKTAWRFINDLLKRVFSADEIELILMYAAQCLLGKNISQTILLIIGEAGTGKTVIVNIIEEILGKSNVTQLRTECLGGHFETQRYLECSLLSGKDVPPDFLCRRGAAMLKPLSGNDTITTETKHSSTVHQFRGNLNIIITANSLLPLNDRDKKPWQQRVRIVQSRGSKPEKPIVEFEKILLAEEGEGIFLLLLQHLEQLLTNGGSIPPSKEQQRVIANLLDESESAKVFLHDRVETVEPKPGVSLRKCEANLTSEELYLNYKAYCATRGWTPIPARKFQDQLVDLMPHLFDRFRVYDIVRVGTKHRGYYAVRFK